MASLLGAVATASAASKCEHPLKLNLKVNETGCICLRNNDEISYDKNFIKIIIPWCGTYPICMGIKALKAGHTTINVTNTKTKNVRQYNITITPT
jgi:hypothetical protein